MSSINLPTFQIDDDFTNDHANEMARGIRNSVEKEAGKGLSANDFTTTLKNKLDGLVAGATANQTDAYLLARGNHSGTQAISTIAGLQAVLDGKSPILTFKTVGGESILGIGDIPVGTGTGGSGVEFTQTEKTKLSGIAVGATANATDAVNRARANHTGTQAISTISGLQTALDGFQLKEAGFGLSSNDFTTAEKTKLATLDASQYQPIVAGKGLSTNDYTTAEKTKLAGIDLSLYALNRINVVAAKTASGTFALGDANSLVPINSSSPTTYTVPPDSAVAFEIGAQFIIEQRGSGAITILSGSGVTIHSADSKTKLRTQFSTASLIKKASNLWLLAGDLI
jgi:hypothetical protein